MKKITLNINEKEYIIEFNRQSLVMMEAEGFSLSKIEDKLITSMELMVYGGLTLHQPNIKWKEAIEVMDYLLAEYEMKDILETLSEMVNDVFPQVGNEKKLSTLVKGK